MVQAGNNYLLEDLRLHLQNKLNELQSLEQLLIDNQKEWRDYAREVTVIKSKALAHEIELIKQRISELS